MPALSAAYTCNILNSISETLQIDQQEALANLLTNHRENDQNESISVMDFNVEMEEGTE